MRLWILLFTSFSVIFFAAVLVWWRLAVAYRQQKVASSILAGVDPAKVAVQSRVLIEAPKTPRGLARFFKSGATSGDAGATAGADRGKFLLTTLLMILTGAMLGFRFTGTIGVAGPVIVASLFGSIPWLYRARKRNKRLAAIEEQFPDALDFLGRSVRAGNAFSIALELLSAEVSDPLKSEIVRITREMALGAALEDALNGLAMRVELVEVRLFVSAVLLQKETGGNLNEILAKLAVSVRERLRLRGQVKAMSGQGRLTAAVLSILPIVLMVVLKIISPAYLDSLTGDSMGRNLLAAGAVSQVLGFVVMKKIIRIEV